MCNRFDPVITSMIFTARNSSCGKVMFSQASVCPRWGRGVHGEGNVRGEGACVAKVGGGVGCAWQERLPLQRMVRILLECILVLFMWIDQSQLTFRKSAEIG